MSEECIYRGHRHQETMAGQNHNLFGDDRQRTGPPTTGQALSTIPERRAETPQQNSSTQATASGLKYPQHSVHSNGKLNNFVLSERYTDLEEVAAYGCDLYETSFDDIFDRQRVTAV